MQLSITKIPSLSAAEIATLTIEDLTEKGSQTHFSTINYLDYFSDAQIAQLNLDVIRHLSFEQLLRPNIAKHPVITQLSGTQIAELSLDVLSTSDYLLFRCFTDVQIPLLPAQLIQQLDYAQLMRRSIGSEVIIVSLFSPAQIASVKTASDIGILFRYLHDQQIAGLTVSQIAAAAPEDFKVRNLDGTRLSSLLSKEQIQACSTDGLGELLPVLSNVQISYLNTNQVAALSANDLLLRNDKGRIVVQLFDQEQIKAINSFNDSLCWMLSDNQVSYLTQQQVELIDGKTLASDTFGKRLINRLTPEQASGITVEALKSGHLIKYLSGDKVESLTWQQIAGLTPDDLLGETQSGKPLIDQLSVRQLRAVSQFNDAMFAYLSDDEVKGLRPDQIASIQPETLVSLTGDQHVVVTKLTDDQTREISNITREVINYLNAHQISLLTSSQIVSMRADALSESYLVGNGEKKTLVSALSGDQIQRLKPEVLKNSKAGSLIQYLNSNQVQHLTREQIMVLDRKELLARDAANKTLASELSGGQVKSLAFQPFSLRPADLMECLSDVQIRELTGGQVAQLESDALNKKTVDNTLVSAALNAKQVSFINARGLASVDIHTLDASGLSNEQLWWFNRASFGAAVVELKKIGSNRKVSLTIFATLGDKISDLNEKTVSGLTKRQLASLDDKHIQLLDGSGLTATQLTYLNASGRLVFSLLTSEQIGKLNNTTFSKLTVEELKAFSSAQVGGIGEAQIGALSADQIRVLGGSGITVAQLNMKDRDGKTVAEDILTGGSQLAELTSAALAGFPFDKIPLLSSDHFSSLSKEQIQSLHGAGFTSAQLNYLDKTRKSVWSAIAANGAVQLSKLTASVVSGLSASKFANLDSSQVQSLNGAGLVSEQLGFVDKQHTSVWINVINNGTRQLAALSTGTIASLTGSQIALLSSAGVRSIDSRGWTPAQLGHQDDENHSVWKNLLSMGVSGVGSLTPATVKGLSLERLQELALNKEQIRVLNANQLNALDAEKIKALDAKWILELNQNVFPDLSDAFLQSLNKDQILNLGPQQLLHMSEHQISLIASAAVKPFLLMTPEEIKNFGAAELVAKLEPSLLAQVSPRTLTTLPNDVIAGLSVDQLKQIPFATLAQLTPQQQALIDADKRPALTESLSRYAGFSVSNTATPFAQWHSNLFAAPSITNSLSNMASNRQVYFYATATRSTLNLYSKVTHFPLNKYSESLGEYRAINEYVRDYQDALQGAQNRLQGLRMIGSILALNAFASQVYEASRTDDTVQRKAAVLQSLSWLASLAQVPVTTLSMAFEDAYKKGQSISYKEAWFKRLGIAGTSSLASHFTVRAKGGSTKPLTLAVPDVSNWKEQIVMSRKFSLADFKEMQGSFSLTELQYRGGAIFFVANVLSLVNTSFQLYLLYDDDRASKQDPALSTIAKAANIANLITGLGFTVADLIPVFVANPANNPVASRISGVIGGSTWALAFAVSSLSSIATAAVKLKNNPTSGNQVALAGTVVSTVLGAAIPSALIAFNAFGPIGSLVGFALMALIPNFSAIGQAIDLANERTGLIAQGRTVEGDIICSRLHTIAATNASPIANWFSFIYQPALMNSLYDEMASNGNFQTALRQNFSYQMNRTDLSADQKGIVNDIRKQFTTSADSSHPFVSATYITLNNVANSADYFVTNAVNNYKQRYWTSATFRPDGPVDTQLGFNGSDQRLNLSEVTPASASQPTSSGAANDDQVKKYAIVNISMHEDAIDEDGDSLGSEEVNSDKAQTGKYKLDMSDTDVNTIVYLHTSSAMIKGGKGINVYFVDEDQDPANLSVFGGDTHEDIVTFKSDKTASINLNNFVDVIVIGAGGGNSVAGNVEGQRYMSPLGVIDRVTMMGGKGTALVNGGSSVGMSGGNNSLNVMLGRKSGDDNTTRREGNYNGGSSVAAVGEFSGQNTIAFTASSSGLALAFQGESATYTTTDGVDTGKFVNFQNVVGTTMYDTITVDHSTMLTGLFLGLGGSDVVVDGSKGLSIATSGEGNNQFVIQNNSDVRLQTLGKSKNLIMATTGASVIASLGAQSDVFSAAKGSGDVGIITQAGFHDINLNGQASRVVMDATSKGNVTKVTDTQRGVAPLFLDLGDAPEQQKVSVTSNSMKIWSDNQTLIYSAQGVDFFDRQSALLSPANVFVEFMTDQPLETIGLPHFRTAEQRPVASAAPTIERTPSTLQAANANQINAADVKTVSLGLDLLLQALAAVVPPGQTLASTVANPVELSTVIRWAAVQPNALKNAA